MARVGPVLSLTLALAACGADGSTGGMGETGDGGTADGQTGTTQPPIEGRWESLAPLPDGPRQETAVVAVDGRVFALGGFIEDAGLTDRVEAYDPASDRWETMAPLPTPAHHLNAGAVDGRLYVLGWLETLQFTANAGAWVYDPQQDAWTERTAMPQGTERGGGAVAVVDDQIVVIGGLRGGQAVTDVWAYDTEADRWSPLPDLPDARDHLVAGTLDGQIHVFGGRSSDIGSHTSSVLRLEEEAWVEVSPMPTSRGGSAGATLDGRFFVAGGEGNPDDPSGVFPQLEVYIAEEDRWATLPPMPTPRHGTGAATLDGVVYIPGGADAEAFGAVATHEAWIPAGAG